MEKDNPIIKIKGLNVVYFLGKSNEVRALNNINLEIYSGEFIIFFGPSGCGKSTLLYSIAGLETNIQGDVFVDDKNLVDMTSRELVDFHQRKTGMIFQAFYLINSLTAKKNILLPQIFINGNKKERNKKALELLDFFGVKDQADKLPSSLSGGQQQRIAICRALVNDPDILLADEPVGNLDSVSAGEVMNLLKTLNKEQKKTVILVTHNPAHLNYAHRVFYVKDGNIIDTKINEAINREVVSEKKVVLGPTISKDLELLARSYSGISSNQAGNLLIPFKSKEIVAEVLTNMTSGEISKIEKKVETLLMLNIESSEEIFKFLDIDEKKGGMGKDKRTAEKLANKIVDIIKEIKVLEKQEFEQRDSKLTSANEEVVQIRQYLADAFDLDIKNIPSLKILDSAIKDRLDNKIDRISLQKKLDLPIKKGGAGLDSRISKKVTKRLELLILGKYK